MATNETGWDLKAFLAEQTLAGKLDSEGGFTIAADKAVKKLSFFGLPQRYDWVLKVVQAANLWRVPRLLVTQTRVATSFSMAPKSQLSQANLAAAFAEPALSNTDPIHALAMALRSLVEQVGLSFVLAIRRQGRTEAPIFAGDDVSQLSPKTRERWAQLKEDGIRLTVSHFCSEDSVLGRYVPTFSQVERRDIEIVQTLQRRAFTSSVPIFLDGRCINSPGLTPAFAPHRGFRLLRTGVLGPSNRFVSHNLPWEPPAGHVHWQVEHPDRPWYLLRGGDWRHLQGYLSTDPMFRELNSHWVLLTRQGVVCRSYRVANTATTTNVLLVVPCDHCRSDLSGLALKPSESDAATINRLRGEVVEALREFAQELGSPQAWSRGAEPTTNSPRPDGKGLDRAGFSLLSESLTTPFRRVWKTVSYQKELLHHATVDPLSKRKMTDAWLAHTSAELLLVAEQFPARGLIQE